MTVRVENSTPMVVRLSWLNSLRVNRDRRLVLPTPDSPISTTEGVERGELSQGRAARSLPELDGLSHLNEELRSEKQEKSCLSGRAWGWPHYIGYPSGAGEQKGQECWRRGLLRQQGNTVKSNGCGLLAEDMWKGY